MLNVTFMLAEKETKKETEAEVARQLRAAAEIIERGESVPAILRDKEGSFFGTSSFDYERIE